MSPGATNARITWGICLGLALVTLVAYWGVFSSGFVNYDDPYYVVQNRHVQAGLTWDGVVWAFTTRACDNWHPLTWLSLMLDDDLYGLNPAGFHATNLALHIFNSILLFLVLQRMTATRWRSAFVAALFALHPLHVESVAWVAERKDVLSTFFFMLTLMTYMQYVLSGQDQAARSASASSPVTRHLSLFYCLTLFFFALSLMAKPMLVTLPFLLLLLDFWPLNRMRNAEFGIRNFTKLVLEKVPFLVLSAISCIVTIWAQTHAIEMAIAFKYRLLNAALSYLRYLVKTIWPDRLYLNYPYPHGWPIWYPIIALLILGWLSIITVRESRKRPYLFTGWFWFLGALVPVIGLVQVGMQSMADRYTYVPLIGLFLVITWLGCDLAKAWRLPPVLLGALAIAAVAACIPVTMIQVGYWKNSFALSQHALRLNPYNFFVEVNLAMSYEAKGQLEPARDHLAKAVKINPYFGETYNKLGWVQMQLGQYADAVESFQAALQHQGTPALAHYGLALAFEKQGKFSDATEQIQAALALEPGNSEDIDEYNLIQEKARQKGENRQAPLKPVNP
jgi:protein O-mannosyl-transferase